MTSACASIWSVYWPGDSNVVAFVLGILQVLTFMGIIVYQWVARRRLHTRGKNAAARANLLIPTYIWILWAFGFTILYAGA